MQHARYHGRPQSAHGFAKSQFYRVAARVRLGRQQPLLAAHDAALHAHHHAAECQICAHISGSGHALPTPILVSPSHAAGTRVLLACLNFAIRERYQTRTAHAPPASALLNVIA
jgi:hypothetical protein